MPKRQPGQYRALGDALYRARVSLHLSQADVARLADDLSDSFISRLEAGHARPSPETLKVLARRLSLSYNELSVMAGYAEAPASDDMMPVRPGYRRVLERLQERFAPEQLTRFEQAMVALFFDISRESGQVPNGSRDDERAEQDPDAAADDENLVGS